VNFESTHASVPLVGLASIMRSATSGGNLRELGTLLVDRAARDPRDANALMDLATVLQLIGDRATALAVQSQALLLQQRYVLPGCAKGDGVRLLALMGPGDVAANTPLEFLVEGTDVTLEMLYVSPHLPLPGRVPEHDVLFVAGCESDENREFLRFVGELVIGWPRPVLNAPERIARLARDSASALLRAVRGIAMPTTFRVDRPTITRICEAGDQIDIQGELALPIIARPVGSHAGKGLAKLDDPSAVLAYMQEQVAPEFYLSNFVDYSSRDRLFRKYRVALIDGRPFLCHMAISSHWMIHYINAGMLESRERRAEEEEAMASFERGFAVRHASALADLHRRLSLEYVVIDCAETQGGDLLVFEVDSGAVVHALDSVDLFPYKQQPMRRVREAFREMLLRAVRCGDRGASGAS